MRVKNKYDYDYLALNIKASVVKRFRLFSKKIKCSQSETLDALVDFFEWHGISPFRRFASQISKEEEKTRKRIDAVIAIIKDIEKTQTKPTTTMLQSLFEEKILEEEPEMIEKKFIDKSPEKKEIEITVPKIRYERLHSKMMLVKDDFGYVLKNVKTVKNSFGKPYFKLELTEGELEKFKRTIKNLD